MQEHLRRHGSTAASGGVHMVVRSLGSFRSSTEVCKLVLLAGPVTGSIPTVPKTKSPLRCGGPQDHLL